MQKIKEFIKNMSDKIKAIDKNKKIALAIVIISILIAIVFGITYSVKNKYGMLFSGLDTQDAANISKELEERGIEMKIDNDSIFVPKELVDKLRLELSATLTNGSKGFELMDEGSNLSMTDEEFQIKKIRMLQGELEKTIKSFPQVNNARVHIKQGDESVFNKDTKAGNAAVYLSLKPGMELEKSQIKSIISLVSSSSNNIPRQNVEVVDENMTLISEGIYDENGKDTNGAGNTNLKVEERRLSEDLNKALKETLQPIFGADKVQATVNATLNLDSVEKNEVKVDPDKVVKSEERSENASLDSNKTGSPVDNNMNNTASGNNNSNKSKEEKIEYEVGKVETKTIKGSGDIKRITASVAIDGNVSDDVLNNVEKIASAAIGLDRQRGDQLSVVTMNFDTLKGDTVVKDTVPQNEKMNLILGAAAGGILLLLIIVGIIIWIKNRRKNKLEEKEAVDSANNYIESILQEREIEVEKKKEKKLTLDEEVKFIASKNPEEVTELIKRWLNE